jgi:hypothetical protein
MLQQPSSAFGGRVESPSTQPRVLRTTTFQPGNGSEASGRPAMTDQSYTNPDREWPDGKGKLAAPGQAPPVRHWPGQRPASTATQNPKCRLYSSHYSPGHGLDSARTHLAINSEPRYRPRIRRMLSRTVTYPLKGCLI